MKIPNIFLLSACFFLFTEAISQPNQTANPAPYIEVTGMAEKEIIPDEIYIAIVIRERYISKEKVSIEDQEVKLKKAIESIGVDLKNLYISDINADYVKIRWQKKDVLTKKDYTLKVSNATTVSRVFQELEKLEITDAYISKVTHSKIDSLKRIVRIEAIRNAKEKADYLLKAIGEKTGKPLVIHENEIMPVMRTAGLPGRGSRAYEQTYIDGVLQDKDTEIEFRKIKISSSIYIKFSIQ